MINIKEKYFNKEKESIYPIELTKNSYIYTDLDNIFISFISYNNILTLIYSTKNNSIISYNLNQFQIITEIKDAHQGAFITNFRHYFDRNNTIDLILSISAKTNNIKIWNNKNWELILNLQNLYYSGRINSACFIQDNLKEIYIVTSNNFFSSPHSIKIFNFDGKKIKKIENSKENVYYLDLFNNENNSKLYLIACCYDYLISYDYYQNSLYKKYYSSESKIHYSFKIINHDKIIKLIESSMDGNIRLWDFESSNLLHIFNVCNNSIYGITLLNQNEIFICGDNSIILLNIENGKNKKIISGFKNWVCCINLIFHNKYGKCIITQGIKDEQIKLWCIDDISK